MNRSAIDRAAAILFALLSAALIAAFFADSRFFHWAFARHHNPLSWYIRPLFLIPFCLAAYRRSHAGIWATLLLLLSSMFWFPPPDYPNERIRQFLAMEQNFLLGGWNTAKVLASGMVALSLMLIAAAFWQRKPRLGLFCLAAAAAGKILWSICYGRAAGYAVILPAAFGLLLCAIVIGMVLHKIKRRP